MRKSTRWVLVLLTLAVCLLVGYLLISLTEAPFMEPRDFRVAPEMLGDGFHQLRELLSPRTMKTLAAGVCTAAMLVLVLIVTAKKPKYHWAAFVLLLTAGALVVAFKPVLENWYSWDEETHYETMRAMLGGQAHTLEAAVSGFSLWGIGYLPTLMGMLLGRIFGAGDVWECVLGLSASMLVYAVMCALAVRHAPKYKISFLVVSALPISLFLAGSLTYDTTIIASVLLGTALVLEAQTEHRALSNARALVLMGLLCVGTLAKPVYSLLLLMLLTLPKACFGTSRRAWLFRLFALAMMLWALGSLLLPGSYADIRNGDDRYAEADAARQISYILSDPMGALGVVGGYLARNWQLLYTHALTTWGEIGSDLTVGYVLLALLLVAAPLCAAEEEADSPLTWRRRLLLLGLSALVLIVLTVTQYVVSSPLDRVDGMQPRYAIPVWILVQLALMLPEGLRKRLRPAGRALSGLTVCAVASVVLLYTCRMLFVALPAMTSIY